MGHSLVREKWRRVPNKNRAVEEFPRRSIVGRLGYHRTSSALTVSGHRPPHLAALPNGTPSLLRAQENGREPTTFSARVSSFERLVAFS